MSDGFSLTSNAILAEQSTTAALGTFLAYTIAVMALAWISNRVLAGRSFLSEYFLGSRNLGTIALTLTLGATAASAGSFAGFPALVYTHGWVLALWIASYMVVPICTLGLLGKRLNQVARKSGAITLPDVLRDRFNSPQLALTATLLMVLMLSFYLVPQFKLAAIILQKLLDSTTLLNATGRGVATITAATGAFASQDANYLACLLMFALLVIVYTTVGGFRAVVWTDVLQGVVMVGGVMILVGLVLWKVGGLASATKELSQMIPPRIGEVVFERTLRSDGQLPRVPSETWFTAPDEQSDQGEPLLLRTNETADFRLDKVRSGPVKVVQIVTPEELSSIRAQWPSGQPPPLPEGVTIHSMNLRDYAHGANQRGMYVSAPGPDPKFSVGFLPVSLAISFFVYYALSTTGQPGNMVRLMAFDSSRTLKRAIAMLTIYFGIIYFPLVIIFCCARIVVPGLDQSSDQIMPELTLTLAGDAGVPWLAGLLIAAPFAAAMSTVDSFMLMISSSFVRDVYQRTLNPEASERQIKRFSYTCMLIVGAVVTVAAANPPQFMQYVIVFAGGGLSVIFLIPMGLALYWPRMNEWGMFAAMLVGLGLYLTLYLVGYIYHGETRAYYMFGMDPIIWGFAASLTAGVVGSLITPAPPEQLVRRYFYASD